jgi:hypothetical protein
MSETIKIKPNAEGRAIANLYGKEFDVTDKSELKAFGRIYKIEVIKSKSQAKRLDVLKRSQNTDEAVPIEPQNTDEAKD